MLGALFSWKAAVLAGTVLACVFLYRAFCRFLCPLGAIYSLFARIALLGVRVDEGLCSGCGACVRSCRMDVRQVGDGECIHCGECLQACPEKAISIRAGKILLKGPETGTAGRRERA